jgi:hypothetical protein
MFNPVDGSYNFANCGGISAGYTTNSDGQIQYYLGSSIPVNPPLISSITTSASSIDAFNAQMLLGQQLTLTAIDTGGDINSTTLYQWSLNQIDIVGATSLQYITTVTSLTQSGPYTIKATNGGGTSIVNIDITVYPIYTFTTSSIGNGTITASVTRAPSGEYATGLETPLTSTQFISGDSLSVIAAPLSGYIFESYSIDGIPTTVNSLSPQTITLGNFKANTIWSFVFSQPTSNVEIITFGVIDDVLGTSGSTTLYWTVGSATTVSVDQGIGSVTTTGSATISPTVTTTYTLTANGLGGPITSSVTVTMATYPTGWYIGSSVSTYTAGTTGGFDIVDNTGYPVETITNIVWRFSAGTVIYPAIVSDLPVTWMAQWIAPTTAQTVIVDATATMANSSVYVLPTITVPVIGLGSPQLTSFWENDFGNNQQNYIIYWTTAGAVSARIYIQNIWTDIPVNCSSSKQVTYPIGSLYTNGGIGQPITIQVYGGPSYTGTMVTQTITIND